MFCMAHFSAEQKTKPFHHFTFYAPNLCFMYKNVPLNDVKSVICVFQYLVKK